MQLSDQQRSPFLYTTLTAAFALVVLLSNLLSAKLIHFPLFPSLLLPAGLLIYPLSFFFNNLIIELFGPSWAKKTLYLTLALHLVAYLLIAAVLYLPSPLLDINDAFRTTFKLSGVRILSSLVASLAGQLVDLQVYARLKKWTGLRFLWLRLNGSTWIGQLVDTIVIDLLFLFWGMGMEFSLVYPVIIFSFTYKILISLLMTPLFYKAVQKFSN